MRKEKHVWDERRAPGPDSEQNVPFLQRRESIGMTDSAGHCLSLQSASSLLCLLGFREHLRHRMHLLVFTGYSEKQAAVDVGRLVTVSPKLNTFSFKASELRPSDPS